MIKVRVILSLSLVINGAIVFIFVPVIGRVKLDHVGG